MAIAIADPLELLVIEMINAERADAGLQPVHTEVHLTSSAQDHSGWMGQEGILSHTGEDGSTPSDRAEDADFPIQNGVWKVTENVAYSSISGPLDEDEIARMHNELMDSTTHKANILDPDINYIGVGLSQGQVETEAELYDVVFLTQNFGNSSQPVTVQEELNGETILTTYVDGVAVPGTSQPVPDTDDDIAPDTSDEIDEQDEGKPDQDKNDPQDADNDNIEPDTGDERDEHDDRKPDRDDDDPQNADNASGGSCFVSTAAYGNRMHPDVVTLRRFRDEVLVRHKAGRAFVRCYWIIGPRMAKVVRHDHIIGRLVRLALYPCVTAVRKLLSQSLK